MPLIIILFLLLPYEVVHSMDEYFLTLRNDKVNLRQGPSFDYPIKIFYKKCNQMASCEVTQKKGSLLVELKREILSKATIYKKEKKDKNFKEYKGSKKLSN